MGGQSALETIHMRIFSFGIQFLEQQSISHILSVCAATHVALRAEWCTKSIIGTSSLPMPEDFFNVAHSAQKKLMM